VRQREEPVQPQGRVLCVHLQVRRAEVENRTFKMLVKLINESSSFWSNLNTLTNNDDASILKRCLISI